MNDTKNLAKLYDRLTIEERFPAMIAANRRGDEVESERLKRTAPRKLVSVPDYHAHAEALFAMVAFTFMQRQARACALLDLLSLSREAERDGSVDDFTLAENAAFLTAWRTRIDQEAWRRFCEEAGFGPHDPHEGLPGWDLVQKVDLIVPPKPDDAQQVAAIAGASVDKVITVERRLNQLRDDWQFWLDHCTPH